LIHNDWRLDNLILAPAPPFALRAILDWEMATVGDGWMDLGNALAYWVQADDPPALQALRRQPSHLPGMPTRRELVARYAEALGVEAPDFRFEEVAGLFRLAVIFQQIYYRFYHRQTTNPAFAGLGALTHLLAARAQERIDG
jgi:aminoglycoside phosphotransferase (APT) family kinase protein